MTSAKHIRLGFVGTGGMGQAAHLINYGAVPGCEVAAIAEIRPKLGAKVAARYGVPKVYTDAAAMIAAEKLDGLVAVQPFGAHIELVPQLLKAGLPLLIEKPLAETLENGQKIAAAQRAAGVPVFLAYHKRSDPATTRVLAQIAEWKQSKAVGAMTYIRVAMPPGDWTANGFWQNLGSDEKFDGKWGWESDLGHFVNFYIHQVNLIRLLLGEDWKPEYADRNGKVLVGRGASGLTVTLEMQTFQSSRDWQEEAFIGFEKGWLKLELPAPVVINRAGRVTIFSDPGNGAEPAFTTPVMPSEHAMLAQAKNFIAACRGEQTVLCTVEDALKDLQVARAYVDMLNLARKT